METANHTPEVDHLGPTFETPPPARRSTCQRFKSDYMRRLQTGKGTCDGCITLDYMRQLRDGDSRHNSPKSSKNATLALIKDELTPDNDIEDVYAMAAGVSEAEGLNPSTVSEARARCHAPNWFSAVNMDKDS